MIKIPKEMLLSKIKEKAGLSDKEIESKVKDKLDEDTLTTLVNIFDRLGE